MNHHRRLFKKLDANIQIFFYLKNLIIELKNKNVKLQFDDVFTSVLRIFEVVMKKIAIFVSGSGTNCENIIKYFSDSQVAEVAVVISNRSDAYALVRARNNGIPAEIVTKSGFEDESVVLGLLKKYSVDFIVLAGFLLKIPDYLVEAYSGRMINLHPALLPKFGGKGMYGMHVHEAVKAAGEKETGMTVHYVSQEVDGGHIIAQFKTDLSPEDTAEDIAAKEHILEIKHFPEVIEKVLKGEL